MLKIKPNPPHYDHDALYYDDKRIGFVGRKSGRKCLERCPKCERENWCQAVTAGVCAWCGWDVNKEDA